MSRSEQDHVTWHRFTIVWNASIRAPGMTDDDFEVRREFISDLASAMRIAETSFRQSAPAYLADATVERAELSVLGDYHFEDGSFGKSRRALIGDVVFDDGERTWVTDYCLGEDADLQEGLAEQMAWAMATAWVETPRREPEPLEDADVRPA